MQDNSIVQQTNTIQYRFSNPFTLPSVIYFVFKLVCYNIIIKLYWPVKKNTYQLLLLNKISRINSSYLLMPIVLVK